MAKRKSNAVLTVALAAIAIAVGISLIYVLNDRTQANYRAGRSGYSFMPPDAVRSVFKRGVFLDDFRVEVVGRSLSGVRLRVTNGTGIAVSRAVIRVRVMAPNRSTPLETQIFDRTQRGGIEPGERQQWDIYEEQSPREFPAGSRFVAEAITLYDAKDNVIAIEK